MKLFLTAVLLLAAGPVLAQGAHHHHGAARSAPGVAAPTQAGQGAFAAIQEVVEILEADPHTDWAKVDVEALRRHLVDMSLVTLSARVAAMPVEGGMRFAVSGEGAVRDAVRRMAVAHAATMDGAVGWQFAAKETADGAEMTVLVPAKDVEKLRGLGFIGVMTRGMHHQAHHLMIARGGHPH